MPWLDFNEEDRTILEALFDTLIPPDEHPGGWKGGVETYLESAFQTDLKQLIPTYKQAIRTLGQAFVEQTPEQRIQTLQDFDPQFINLAAPHASEGYYAASGPGWEMIGYQVTA